MYQDSGRIRIEHRWLKINQKNHTQVETP